MKLPEYAIKKLKEEHEHLDRSFSRMWGLLSPTPERDEIMWHIISAKRLVHKMITENEEELK